MWFANFEAVLPETPESISSSISIDIPFLVAAVVFKANINLDLSPPLATLFSSFIGSPLFKDILKFKQDVLLVAHAGSINGMISILTKEPFDKLVKNYWEKIKHGSLTSVQLNEKKVIIEYIGK